MPCFSHRDATGKCNHTNQNYKFVNDIKADQEADYNTPDDKDLVAKEKQTRKKESKDGSNMEEDPAPSLLKKLRLELAGQTYTKIPKRELSTHSLVLPWLRHKEPPCAPLRTPCLRSASTSNGPKYRCNGVAKITQSTSRMDTMPWWSTP
jgi:hypothetical protein